MKRLNKFWAVSILLIPALLFPGCKDDSNQELIDQEMRLLEKYVEENNITQEPTASGLYYIPLTEGTGRQAEIYDIVDFEYTGELLDGTIIYTSDEQLARDNEIYSSSIMYGPIRLQAGYTGIPGLDEGLLLMKEGGKAKLIMPSSINGYGGVATSFSPAFSTHIYTIELLHSFDDPVIFEQEQISKYLADQEIDGPYITESGLYYIETQAGEGELITDGDYVKVWYTGSFLDGRVFDSNVGDETLTVTLPAFGYIPAWDEALRMMRKGTEAKIIVPYELAYAEEGKGKIPPYMTLVFEMKIEDVVTGK